MFLHNNFRPGVFVVAIVCLMSVMQGCTSTKNRTAGTLAVGKSQSVSPDLGSLVEGDSVTFLGDGGLQSPLGQVTIGREYLAASGRVCKRILSVDGEELLSVICKAADERWYMRKLS